MKCSPHPWHPRHTCDTLRHRGCGPVPEWRTLNRSNRTSWKSHTDIRNRWSSERRTLTSLDTVPVPTGGPRSWFRVFSLPSDPCAGKGRVLLVLRSRLSTRGRGHWSRSFRPEAYGRVGGCGWVSTECPCVAGKDRVRLPVHPGPR